MKIKCHDASPPLWEKEERDGWGLGLWLGRSIGKFKKRKKEKKRGKGNKRKKRKVLASYLQR